MEFVCPPAPHPSHRRCRPEPLPDKLATSGPSSSWRSRALALRQWLAPNKVVHSWGDARSGARSRGGQEREEQEQVDDAGSDSEESAAAAATGFASLPEELLERILMHLAARGYSRQTHFNVCAVCRTWRRLGRQLFFATPWSEHRLLCHPAQLFCLSPRAVETSRSGLLKCFLRREPRSGICGGLRRYSLFMGRDHKQPRKIRFLMCAVQVSRCETLIYLNKEGRGQPVGRLASNTLCTHYDLSLAPGWQLLGGAAPPGAAAAGAAAAAAASAAAAAPAAEGGVGPGLGLPSPRSPGQEEWAAPEGLGSLRYRARLRGFMQPRRVDVELPPPAQLSFGRGLPMLCRASTCAGPAARSSSSSSGGGCGSGGGGDSGTPRSSPGPSSPGPSSPGPSSSAPAEEHAGADAGGRGSPGPSPSLPAVPGEGAAPSGGSGPAAGQPGPPEEQQQGQGQGQGEAPVQALQPPPSGGCRLSLRNKQPQWNNDLRCWCLNFRGRVKQASVKNFQLVREGDLAERVLLQFGKVETDIYILDFQPQLISTFQAFSIALSTFGSKFIL